MVPVPWNWRFWISAAKPIIRVKLGAALEVTYIHNHPEPVEPVGATSYGLSYVFTAQLRQLRLRPVTSGGLGQHSLRR